MSNLVTRLVSAIEAKNLTVKEMERISGLTNGVISSANKRDGNIGTDKLVKIFDQLPGLNANWLLTGQGEMWLNGQQPAGTVAVQLSTGHQANNTQHVGDAAALAIAQERIKALENQVQHLTDLLAAKDEIIALLKRQG